MSGSYLVFESVDLLYYDLDKTTLTRGESYIESPKYLINKGATINPKNEKDDKCFQYALTLALNYNRIKKKDLEKILKIKWKDIDFLSHQKDWKKFEQNNNSIALNVLFISHKSEELTLAYELEHNFMQENQVLLLMINGGPKNVIISL